jgi:starch synthase
MISAENGALPGGKVGGIGDVVRELPTALAKRNNTVSVLTPGYGIFGNLPGAQLLQRLTVRFAGRTESLELYYLDGMSRDRKIRHYAIDHPLFSSGGNGKIYCDDPPSRPFESDASKFALFCIAVAEALRNALFGDIDTVHLHDWHAAFLLILRRYDPVYRSLQALRCVYSIHNLAIQGIRPFAGQESSLDAWFPDLVYPRQQLADPRWSDCVNPMAVAIRLADAVNTVSPSYAEEILRPSDARRGYYGGEGLEQDLQQAKHEHRLFGILNGCEYPRKKTPALAGWAALRKAMHRQVLIWASRQSVVANADFIANQSIAQLSQDRPSMVITSVGRITDQKIGLMRQTTSSGQPALHAVLDVMGATATFLMVGSGDTDSEQFLIETSARYTNFVFLRGYSEALGNALYQQGDLFFMPSSFEPCGISQMLALRSGQPCLVHAVGGLRDTIDDNKTGFVFAGTNPSEQADALVATLKRALTLYQTKPAQWKTMRKSAAAARFKWADSIDAYLEQLYQTA